MFTRSADSLVSALSGYPPAEARLEVQPTEIAWVAEEQFAARLRERGWTPGSSPNAGWTIDVVVDDIAVRYSNPRAGGIFASGLLDRTVATTVRVQVRSQGSEDLIVDGRYSPSIRDTIASTDVDFLETSYLPFTRGRVPPAGFFSTVLEPVVVTATIAVAVLLLFTVRSN